MEPQYTEIVDIDAVDRAIVICAIALPVLSVLVGLVIGFITKKLRLPVLRGLAIGVAGPVLLGLWRYYRYMIRFDPETGYVGLHRFSVYIINLVVFIVIGALLGIAYTRLSAWLRPPGAHESEMDNSERISSRNL